MRIMKTCEICGSKYYTGNGKAKYCSDECKKEATKRRQKKWREEHPDYHKEYHKEHSEVVEKFKESHPNYDRDRWRKIRGSEEHTKKCVICGKMFSTWNPNKKTCSDECKDKNKKLRAGIRDKRRSRKRSYEENHIRWIKRRYGSEEAHQEYLAELEEKKQESMKLTKERKEAEKKAKKEANHRFGTCAVCGNTFETYNPRQKTCSKVCSKKYSNARKNGRIPQEQMVDKDITLEALYRRDSGVCYLCGEKCDWNDRDLFTVRDKYPTIDHIIPVSRGGLHSWDNVRLAHFKCNLDKSDEIIPEAKKMIPANAYEFKREIKQQKKKTLQLTKDNQFLTEYESTAEAERQTGIKQRGIQKCASGACKSYGGFVWRYA